MSLPYVRVPILWMLFFVPISSHAQQTDETSAPPTTPSAIAPLAPPTPVPSVTISDKAYDARRDDTASKIVVHHAQIVRFGDTSLPAALKRLPGITVDGGIRLRGMDSGYVQILLNGEPAPPGFSLESVAPHTVDRIEIMRSGSAEYSARSIAGTLNILLKRPTATLKRTVNASLGTQPGTRTRSSSFQLSNTSGQLAYAIVGNIAYSDGDMVSGRSNVTRDSSGTPLARSASRASNANTSTNSQLNARLNWRAGARDSLAANINVQSNRSKSALVEDTRAMMGPPPPIARRVGDTVTESDSVSLGGSWLRKLDNGATFDLRGTTGFSARKTPGALDAYGPREEHLVSRRTAGAADQSNFNLSGKYRGGANNGHAFVTGWESERSYYDDTFMQAERPALVFAPVNRDDLFKTSMLRLAVFAQDEWRLTERWSVYAGLRWESIETRNSGSELLATVNRAAVTSPIVQTLWKISADGRTQLRAAVARTYKQVPAGLLTVRRTVNLENGPLKPDYQGNPALRPELAWGVDAAIEHFGERSGMVALNVFAKRIDDVTGREVVQRDGRWLSMPVNVGQADSFGIEVEAKAALKDFFASAPALEFRFNANRNWSRVSYLPSPHNRLPGQNPGSLNFGVDYRASAGLSMGANFSAYLSNTVSTSPRETTRSREPSMLDMYAQLELSKRARLRASASNLRPRPTGFNSLHIDGDGAIEESSRSPSYRNVRITLEHKFD